ncbi:MAG: carboxypeptidase-like regulatory domain-containing protein, partial [bacterium]
KLGIVFIIGILFLNVQSAYAASKITGFVYEKESGSPLPGANVFIQTDEQTLGSATDTKGKFTISNVPPGEYVLNVTYIGYQKASVNISVGPDETVEIDVEMTHETVKGETVVVTGQAAGQTAAINQQISANTIKNIVSSTRIQELPDESAAAALSRLPGLSLQEGDKVVIRGLEAKLNTVLVNGVALPSTDMEDRSTNLGFISSNMLEGIEVTKVLTPDMDANTIGGVVDLRIKEAPVGLHFDVLSQGMYNTQDRTTDNYKLWTSISNRFLNDKLGVFLQGNADRQNRGIDQTSARYVITDANINYGHAPYTMNGFNFIDEVNIITNYGGSLVLDYKLPAGKIVLQNTIAHTINDNAQNRA